MENEAEEPPRKHRKLSHDESSPGIEDAPINSPAGTSAPGTAGSSQPEPSDAPAPLSKSAQKRLLKAAAWEANRGARIEARKLKTAAKRKRQRAARDEFLSEQGWTIEDWARDRSTAKPLPTQVPITFLIDCGYDTCMRENERTSLASQITRCYGENKRAHWRAHLAVSSFGGLLKERFEGPLKGFYKGWKGFKCREEGFKEVAELAEGWMREQEGGEMIGPFEGLSKEMGGEVVYLSSEADETLEELKPFSTYIVGGLVDKNREKGICYKAACDAGIRTARLPIGEFLEMQTRKVLATNHVVEIMLKWLEHKDWGKALFEVIPKRKGRALKGEAVKAEDAAADDDEADQQDEIEPLEPQQEGEDNEGTGEDKEYHRLHAGDIEHSEK